MRSKDRAARRSAPARLIILSLLAGGTAYCAELARPPSPPGVGIERGVAFIQCRRGVEGRRYITRGAVIDLGKQSPAHEVILTAAHGLPRTSAAVRRDCSIAEGRRSYALQGAWFGDGRDGPHDWAVLSTTRGFGREIHRLRVAALEAETLGWLIEQAAPARLLLRRAESEQENCGLAGAWLPPEEVATGLFLHSCRSWEGLSGSPIVVSMDGATVLIGIQLGRIRRPPSAEGPPYLHLGRAIDNAIADTITHVAMRSAPP